MEASPLLFYFYFTFCFWRFFFFVSLLVFTPSSLADEGVMATDPVCHEHHYMLTWNEYLKTFTSFQNIEFDKKTVESPLQTLKFSISSFENLFLPIYIYVFMYMSIIRSIISLFLLRYWLVFFSYLNILSWHFVHSTCYTTSFLYWSGCVLGKINVFTLQLKLFFLHVFLKIGTSFP